MIRQRNTFLSIIQNWKSVEASIKSATNSLGSADEENEKYINSIAGKIDQLTNSFQNLSESVISSDVIKGVVDSLNILVKILDVVTENVGIFGIALSATLSGVFIKTLKTQISETGLSFLTLSSNIGKAGAALKSFLLTNPIGWILIAGTAITGISKGIEYLSEGLERAQTKAQESKNKYTELAKEVSSINDELSTTSDRIEELNSLDNLTLVEQEELDRLKLANTELERELRIKQTLAQMAQREAAQDAVNAIEYDSEKYNPQYGGESGRDAYAHVAFTHGDRISATEFYIAQAREYKDEIANLREEQRKLEESYNNDAEKFVNDNNWKAYNLTIQGIESQIESVESNMSDNIKDLMDEDDALYDVYGNIIKGAEETVNRLEEVYADFDLYSSGDKTISQKLDEYFSEANDTVLTKLSELYNAGEISEQTIQSVDTYNKILSDTGVSANQLLSYLGDKGTKNVITLATALIELSDETKTYKDIIDDLDSPMTKVVKAQKELEKTGLLSYETYKELISIFPDLEKSVTSTTGGYKVENSVLEDLISTKIGVYELDLNNAKKVALEVLSSQGYETSAYDGTTKSIYELIKAKTQLLKADAAKTSFEYYYYRIGKDSIQNYTPYTDLLKQISDMEKLLDSISGKEDALSNAEEIIEQIRHSVNSVTTSNTTSGATKEFTGQIDFAKQSLDILAKSVTEAEKKLNNTTGYDNQIKAIKSLIETQRTLVNGYNKTTKVYENLYKKSIAGLSKSQITSLTSGTTFKVSDYTGQEDLYNQLINSQNLYNQWQSSIQQYEDSKQSFSDMQLKKSDLIFNKSVDDFDAKLKSIDDVLSEISQYSSFVGDDSVEYITLLQTGMDQASEKAQLLQDEMSRLHSEFSKGNISGEQYSNRIEELTSELYSTSSAIKTYYNDIQSAMKIRLDSEISDLEKSEETILSTLEQQLDKHKEITDERKKALRISEEEYAYSKKINEHNKDIGKIAKRMAELQLAVNSGDTSALKEYRELQEQMDEEQEDLQDTQHDREIELAENALDEEYDLFEKNINQQINDIKDEYDKKISYIQNVYETEKNLIIEAAKLTESEFTKAYNNIKSVMSSVFTSVSDGFTNAYNNTGNSVSQTATKSAVTTILNTADKTRSSDGLSGLNQYLVEKGYGVVSKPQMVSLAQSLGLSDIDSIDMVGTDPESRKNKNRILEALKNAGFATGGSVNVNTSSIASKNIRRLTGEDGIALVRNNEKILTPDLWDNLKDMIKIQPNISQLVRLNENLVGKLSPSQGNKVEITGTLLNIEHVDKDVDIDALANKAADVASKRLLDNMTVKR